MSVSVLGWAGAGAGPGEQEPDQEAGQKTPVDTWVCVGGDKLSQGDPAVDVKVQIVSVHNCVSSASTSPLVPLHKALPWQMDFPDEMSRSWEMWARHCWTGSRCGCVSCSQPFITGMSESGGNYLKVLCRILD